MRNKKSEQHTHKHTHTNQMDRNTRANVPGIFLTFQAVGTSWLAFAISIVLDAKSEKPLTVCCVYRLREKCFSEGEILLIFRFFAHHHFVLVAFYLTRTRTRTHTHTHKHFFFASLQCVYILKWSQFLAAVFSMCLQSYRTIYPY